MAPGNVTAFSFNCSTPPEGVNFVSNPAVRGTLDIVWSCLGVIILSTWHGSTVLEGAIVEFEVHRSVWQRVKDAADRCWQLMVGILGPEGMTGCAALIFMEARGVYKAGIPYALADGVDWDMRKAFYAVWEGFVIEFDPTKYTAPLRTTISRQSGYSDGCDMTRPYPAESTTELLAESSTAYGGPEKKRIVLKGGGLLHLRKIGVLDKLPAISSADLKDRSKSDSLLEALALTQTVWLVIQVVVRFRKGLFVTQFEVITIAFAVLDLVTRIFDWNRAKDVRLRTTVYATRDLTQAEEDELETLEAPSAKWFGLDGDKMFVLIFAGVGFIFGGMHCLAWHEQFPTAIERTLWRVTAVLTAIIPGVGIVIERLSPRFPIKRNTFQNTVLYPIVGIYSLGRVFIMVETVRSLFYAPPGAFVATWTTNLPYFG